MLEKGRLGYLHSIDFIQVTLNFTSGKPTGIQRNNLVIELSEPGLTLGDDDWFKTAIPITMDRNRHVAKKSHPVDLTIISYSCANCI